MKKVFNDTLDAGHVVLAIDSRFCYDNGDSEWAIIWSGSEVYSVCTLSGYVNKGEVIVDATKEQREEASAWYVDNKINTKGLIGCVVELKRSRKAPNRTPLLVTDYRESYFDNYRYRQYPEMIEVNVDGEPVWVSASCVDNIVKGAKPFWA